MVTDSSTIAGSRRANGPLIPHTTFCAGYWLIEKNNKNSREHYVDHIPKSCRMIAGGRLVLFHDSPDVLAMFQKVCRQHDIQLADIRIPVEDLPTFPQSGGLLRQCEALALDRDPGAIPRYYEKGYNHYWRDYKGSGARAYRQMVAIWTSKIPLVTRVAERENPFGTDQFSWMDASISRFSRLRDNWDFTTHACPENALAHYGSVMRCFGRRIPVNASVMFAKAHVWRPVNDLFLQSVDEALSDVYAHDEETILARTHARDPSLFHCLGRAYGRREYQLRNLPEAAAEYARRTALGRRLLASEAP